MSQFENVVVKMMYSESSYKICIESKQDQVFQVRDVITGDQHLIVVVETPQDDFTKSNSISSSQEMISSDVINWGKWGELSSLGCRSI